MNRAFVFLAFLAFALGLFAHEPAQLTTVILVRHAEKVADPSTKDPALSPAGQERAQRLARMLANSGVTAIYTTPYVRTRSTAAPLAAALKLTPVEVDAKAPMFAADMAAVIRKQPGATILVVGHSNSTPEVMRALGITNAPAIDETEYDDLFVVTLGANVEPHMVQLRY